MGFLRAHYYDQVLRDPDIIGLAIGTRPDCVPDAVLNLLLSYQQRGYEVWLELGLQSSFDETLRRVNRGHGFSEYQSTVVKARKKGLQVCTHLIIGLPGENPTHYNTTLRRVIELGVDGLKLHPLHVVKGTQLANEWRRGEYQPLTLGDYVEIAVNLIEYTPRAWAGIVVADKIYIKGKGRDLESSIETLFASDV